MNKSFDATESSLVITYKADEDQSFYTMVIDSFDDLDSEREVYEFYTVDGKGDVSDKSHTTGLDV